MGGDGGCIATQREFMRGTCGSRHFEKAAAGGQNHGAGYTGGDAERGDFRVRQRAVRVRSCALSSERLAAPVVADDLGNLFNKIAVLEALSAGEIPSRFRYVRGLRDLYDCKLAPVPAGGAAYLNGEGDPCAACPVTGEVLDGSRHFVVSRSSGHVLSERAVSEVGVDALQQEYGPFTTADLVRVCPDDDVLRRLADEMLARRAAEKPGKKRKKKAKRAAAAEAAAPAAKAAKRSAAPATLAPAAEIARAARAKTEAAHANAALGCMFHEDGVVTDPKELFIVTAGTRYNLN